MNIIYDVVIIGAGPCGMMAAISAGRKGFSTILLEKKSRLGIKLSITGRGRCNLTNSAQIREFVSSFRNGNFLYCALSQFSNQDLIEFFENIGVKCKQERGGRYFPQSDKALDIVNALVKQVKKYSKIQTLTTVKNIRKENDIFIINTGTQTYHCKNVIVATGGLSYPNTGSTGDGYAIAKSFGIKIINPIPALTPVIVESNLLSELKGLKLKNVELSYFLNEKLIAKEFGEMEFTSFGVDGPIVLTLSGLVSQNLKKGKNYFLINFKPALNLDTINNRVLRELDKYGKYQLKDMLKELLPKQLVKPFITYANLNMTKKCALINKQERQSLIDALTGFHLDIKGVCGFDFAIITRGGVDINEINQKTMETKKVKGLYFAGEVLDVDAVTGGFNLQAAFSMGYVAGNSVV